MDGDWTLLHLQAPGLLAAEVGSPPEERVVECLQKMTALNDKGHDGGPQVVGGDRAVDFVREKCGLHLHELLEKKVVELCDLRHEVQGGHQWNVEGVETDDGQTLDNVTQLLHRLLVDVPLVDTIFSNEEELAERSQKLLRESLQPGPHLLAAGEPGGDQELPGWNDLRHTLQSSVGVSD